MVRRARGSKILKKQHDAPKPRPHVIQRSNPGKTEPEPDGTGSEPSPDRETAAALKDQRVCVGEEEEERRRRLRRGGGGREEHPDPPQSCTDPPLNRGITLQRHRKRKVYGSPEGQVR